LPLAFGCIQIAFDQTLNGIHSLFGISFFVFVEIGCKAVYSPFAIAFSHSLLTPFGQKEKEPYKSPYSAFDYVDVKLSHFVF